jgi:hypothetical protein
MTDYESAALPTELRRLLVYSYLVYQTERFKLRRVALCRMFPPNISENYKCDFPLASFSSSVY